MLQVLGMPELNGTEHVVEVLQSDTFQIGSTVNFPVYVGGGVAKQKKVPVQCSFATLEESLVSPKIDESMHSDFSKVCGCCQGMLRHDVMIDAPPSHYSCWHAGSSQVPR
jgi:hypothetical protein